MNAKMAVDVSEMLKNFLKENLDGYPGEWYKKALTAGAPYFQWHTPNWQPSESKNAGEAGQHREVHYNTATDFYIEKFAAEVKEFSGRTVRGKATGVMVRDPSESFVERTTWSEGEPVYLLDVQNLDIHGNFCPSAALREQRAQEALRKKNIAERRAFRKFLGMD